ncbi:MAG: hypothetical protein ABW222_05535 [Actinomycetota bacterium]|jgi:hypothetical protein
MVRQRTRVFAVLLAILAALGLVGLGRATAANPGARTRAYHDGALAGYADGFGDGRAEGLQEGRALAVAAASPPGTRDRVKAAFDAGYRAGADSAFGGYDGGWSLGEPYVIVLAKGGNGITYRIAARILARDGVDYHRCPPPTSICQQPRG